jgi:hypothetical protein
MQSFTRPGTSSSVSGQSTTKGYSTRQSVASVTCETRERPSKQMLSRRVCATGAQHFGAQGGGGGEAGGEAFDGDVRRRQQLRDGLVALAALLDLGEAVAQGADQCFAAAGIVEQVVFKIRIALHHPDVAQHLVEHARRTAGDALGAQPVEQRQASGPSRRMTISRSENEV